MPRLWEDTIESHRRAVIDTTIDTTATLVAEHGIRAVTMSQIAAATGIGRATLYKYFPDIEAILLAWHDRHVSSHLAQLHAARDRAEGAAARLETVLMTYALITHERRNHLNAALTGLLHRDDHIAGHQAHLRHLVADALRDAVNEGTIRDDIDVDELATYCLHSLTAAADLPTEAAVRRLVVLTLTGLHYPPP